jgi:hypothetical protein
LKKVLKNPRKPVAVYARLPARQSLFMVRVVDAGAVFLRCTGVLNQTVISTKTIQ